MSWCRKMRYPWISAGRKRWPACIPSLDLLQPNIQEMALSRLQNINLAAFQAESNSLPALWLQASVMSTEKWQFCFGNWHQLQYRPLEMKLGFFPQLQISTSSLPANNPSAAPSQRGHCSTLAEKQSWVKEGNTHAVYWAFSPALCEYMASISHYAAC